jgi:hypothetical protein
MRTWNPPPWECRANQLSATLPDCAQAMLMAEAAIVPPMTDAAIFIVTILLPGFGVGSYQNLQTQTPQGNTARDD